MSCQETAPLLGAYADGELDLVTSIRVEAHLRECPQCRARRQDLAVLRQAVGSAGLYAPAPPRVLRAAGSRVRELRRAAAGGRRRFVLGVPLAAGAALAAVAIGAVIVAWPSLAPAPERVVYHLNDSREAAAALRNLSNHLEASPHARIVVVAHNAGVDFLLDGARDGDGRPFRAAVGELKARGVDFRVCGNTLTRRGIDPLKLIPEATLVPSGVAEIARLQTREGYRYVKP